MLSTLAALAFILPAQSENERPNILFAFADDWGQYASAYAELKSGGLSDVLQTPHFDKLAAEGALFANAFVSAPSCTPCRSSLLSGRHFWQTGRGSILLGATWDGSYDTYPLVLQDNGYHIGHTYKTWGPGNAEVHPVGGRETQYQRRGGKFNRFSQYVMGGDIPTRKAELLAEARGNFVDCVEDAKAAGKPFCYWFGPTNVHRAWVAGSGLTTWGINPDDLKGKVPPFLPDSPTVRQDLADYLGEVMAFDAALGEMMDELDERGLTGNTLFVVSGDHGAPGFPNGKCNLYDFGTQVALVARWPGTIPPGRVVTDFVSLPQLAPTFLEAAGLEPADTMTVTSIMPLLTSSKSGRIDESNDAVFHGRERHVDEAQPDFKPYPCRAIRTDDWLLIRNFRPERFPMGVGPAAGMPNDEGTATIEKWKNDTFAGYADLDASPTKAEIVGLRDLTSMYPYFQIAFDRRPEFELYDLKTDPHQTVNLAEQTNTLAIQRQLTERLMTTLRETDDPRLIDDGAFYETGEMAADDVKNNKRRNPNVKRK